MVLLQDWLILAIGQLKVTSSSGASHVGEFCALAQGLLKG